MCDILPSGPKIGSTQGSFKLICLPNFFGGTIAIISRSQT
jgi:hypothetical protein